MVDHLHVGYDATTRRACDVLRFGRSSYHYQVTKDPQLPLKRRLKELAEIRVSYGYRRLHVLLQREEWRVNHKRVYRLYRKEDSQLRTKKPRRRRSIKPCIAQPAPAAEN